MSTPIDLLKALRARFKDALKIVFDKNEITAEVQDTQLHSICPALRDESCFSFEMLVDICGIDYQEYGLGEWVTNSATHTGFDRAISQADTSTFSHDKPRFAAVYHLLSIKHNHRLRLRAFASKDKESDPLAPSLDSVTDIWPSANWYEREAFDLYGIQFRQHPDPRRLLTDYDFEGHPFRKDFPLIGKKEVRYDAKKEKVIYEPVTSVTPRTVIPKVIRSKESQSMSSQDTPKEY